MLHTISYLANVGFCNTWHDTRLKRLIFVPLFLVLNFFAGECPAPNPGPNPNQAPGKPIGLSATPKGTTEILVEWRATDNATKYNLFDKGEQIGGDITGTTSYSHTGLAYHIFTS